MPLNKRKFIKLTKRILQPGAWYFSFFSGIYIINSLLYWCQTNTYSYERSSDRVFIKHNQNKTLFLLAFSQFYC